MQRLSVKQLAELTGVSVRTLHHYDKIGLLKPGRRSETNYRYYGEQECLRLQQILLYRELELPLSAIKALLDDPEFDAMAALKRHKETIRSRRNRLGAILETVENTIAALKSNSEIMDYRSLYAGFGKEKADSYKNEAEERWGKEIIEESHNRLLSLSKDEWEELLAFGERLNSQLASLVEEPPGSKEVQQLIALHFVYIGKHFDVTKAIYKDMGSMYAEDERFRAYYDQYNDQLAGFMKEAIEIFCRS